MHVQVSDTDALTVTDDAPVILHQGVRHSRHGETPGPPPPPPPVPAAPGRSVIREVTGPRRTTRFRLPPDGG